MDLLAALSVATDLGMGQPPETALRSCLLATGLARAMDLPEAQVRDTCLGALLRHVGCTATASVEARLYGDELVSRRAAQPADFGNPREMLNLTLSTGRGAGIHRPRLIARAMLGDLRHGTEIFASVCDAASLLARRLGLGRAVQDCVAQQFERWDGKGPYGLAKDETTLPARISEVATQAVLFLAADGPDAALAMVDQRAGGWFDPEVADVFRRAGPGLMSELDAADPWQELVEAEPAPVAYVGEPELDRVARCFADMVDLKSRYTLGTPPRWRSSRRRPRAPSGSPSTTSSPCGGRLCCTTWAGWASRAQSGRRPGHSPAASGSRSGCTPTTPSGSWRAHPTLAPLGRIAGLHHERLDGSGYHHGLSAAAIPDARPRPGGRRLPSRPPPRIAPTGPPEPPSRPPTT